MCGPSENVMSCRPWNRHRETCCPGHSTHHHRTEECSAGDRISCHEGYLEHLRTEVKVVEKRIANLQE